MSLIRYTGAQPIKVRVSEGEFHQLVEVTLDPGKTVAMTQLSALKLLRWFQRQGRAAECTLVELGDEG